MTATEKTILREIIARHMKMAARIKERITGAGPQAVAQAYYDGIRDVGREITGELAADRRRIKRGRVTRGRKRK